MASRNTKWKLAYNLSYCYLYSYIVPRESYASTKCQSILISYCCFSLSAIHRNSAASGLFIQAIHSRCNNLSKVSSLWGHLKSKSLYRDLVGNIHPGVSQKYVYFQRPSETLRQCTSKSFGYLQTSSIIHTEIKMLTC